MPSASSPALATERPGSPEEAAQALAEAARTGRRVRISGGATKLGWGCPLDHLDGALSTGGLDRLVEHNQGDLTAVLQAGVRLEVAQETFAGAGQMLALDPPPAPQATIGGLVATGDSGPMRHRYGAVRDLIVGATVALPDGTLAHAGGKVIKNVAGYDLAKLLSGSLGTLGVIVEVVFRLHPRPATQATAVGRASSPSALAAGVAALVRAPLELQCLDVAWQGGSGAVMARAAGSAAEESVRPAGRILSEAGLEVELLSRDEPLWGDQRSAQRAGEGETVVRVSGLTLQLAAAVEAADAEGARLVGRAALGLCWLTLPAAEPDATVAAVQRLRRALAPSPCVVLDGPEAVRAGLDPWDVREGPELELMRRLKARFDPAGTCNPGLYVGGL